MTEPQKESALASRSTGELTSPTGRHTLARVFQRLFNILCVVAALSLGGAQYGIGQAAACAGMLMDYSEEGSFVTAVVRTFDGTHPCDRCLKIQEESGKEQHSPKQRSIKEAYPLTLAASGHSRWLGERDRALLGIVPEHVPAELDGYHPEAFRPPERA
jgi:hypothetical protein